MHHVVTLEKQINVPLFNILMQKIKEQGIASLHGHGVI